MKPATVFKMIVAYVEKWKSHVYLYLRSMPLQPNKDDYFIHLPTIMPLTFSIVLLILFPQ
jgi:hypothetical protein